MSTISLEDFLTLSADQKLGYRIEETDPRIQNLQAITCDTNSLLRAGAIGVFVGIVLTLFVEYSVIRKVTT